MPNLCPQNQCTGCGACRAVCPRDAIALTPDRYGEAHPEIAEALCIGCGACEAVCPALHPVPLVTPRACYAAWAVDPAARAGCASGGLGTALARAVVTDGGVAYGASFAPGLVLRHEAAETLPALERQKSSKYAKSDVSYALRALHLARDGRERVFFGTPCQVAAAHRIAGDDPHLALVDLVCHGTPPLPYLQSWIGHLRPDTAVDNATFRGEEDFLLSLYANGARVYAKPVREDAYYYAFLKGVLHCESCYSCPYARVERCSDLTIGDFWGLPPASVGAPGNVSLLLVHTPRGQALLNRVAPQLALFPRPLAEAVAGNEQLRAPATPHKKRAAFREAYPALGFAAALAEADVVPPGLR